VYPSPSESSASSQKRHDTIPVRRSSLNLLSHTSTSSLTHLLPLERAKISSQFIDKYRLPAAVTRHNHEDLGSRRKDMKRDEEPPTWRSLNPHQSEALGPMLRLKRTLGRRWQRRQPLVLCDGYSDCMQTFTNARNDSDAEITVIEYVLVSIVVLRKAEFDILYKY